MNADPQATTTQSNKKLILGRAGCNTIDVCRNRSGRRSQAATALIGLAVMMVREVTTIVATALVEVEAATTLEVTTAVSDSVDV